MRCGVASPRKGSGGDEVDIYHVRDSLVSLAEELCRPPGIERTGISVTVFFPCARAREGGNHKSSDWIRSRDRRRCRTNNLMPSNGSYQYDYDVDLDDLPVLGCVFNRSNNHDKELRTSDIRSIQLNQDIAKHLESPIHAIDATSIPTTRTSSTSPLRNRSMRWRIRKLFVPYFRKNSWPPHSTRRVFKRSQETPLHSYRSLFPFSTPQLSWKISRRAWLQADPSARQELDQRSSFAALFPLIHRSVTAGPPHIRPRLQTRPRKPTHSHPAIEARPSHSRPFRFQQNVLITPSRLRMAHYLHRLQGHPRAMCPLRAQQTQP